MRQEIEVSGAELQRLDDSQPVDRGVRHARHVALLSPSTSPLSASRGVRLRRPELPIHDHP